MAVYKKSVASVASPTRVGDATSEPSKSVDLNTGLQLFDDSSRRQHTPPLWRGVSALQSQ